MEDIKIIHNNCIEEIILINYFTSKVERLNKESGEFILENDILKIKWDNELYEEYLKDNSNNDELYVYNQINDINFKNINNVNHNLHIIHNNWNDYCIIKDNLIYRSNNKDEYGKFTFKNNLLIIYWEKWNYEIFFPINSSNNSYKFLPLYSKIIHKDWEDYCFITDNYIYRQSNEKEIGNYIFENNVLTINWENWDPDIFILLNDEFYQKNLVIDLIINNLSYLLVNNKLYYEYNISGHIEFKDNNIANIAWINNILEDYFYKYDNKHNIKIFKDSNINIRLLKDNYFECNINFLNNKISSLYNKGDFFINNEENYIIINWENNDLCEKYILLNNIYYYNEYLELNNQNILCISEKHKINIKINIFENYFITENNNKIYFLKNNNIFYILDQNNLKKFYLDKFLNNYLLIIESIYVKINLKNRNIISDLDTYLYSPNSINILYNNLFFNEYSINNNNPINIHNYIKLYDNLIFIINLDNIAKLESILEIIPKVSNIIINLKYNYDIDFLIENYKNLIITKSYINNNFFILKNIIDQIFVDEKINNFNIFYINNDYYLEENIINLPNLKIEIKNIEKNIEEISKKKTIVKTNVKDKIYINKNNNFIIRKYNFLYNLLFLVSNYIEIIIIFIFFYILQKNIYNLGNDNFIVNLNTLFKITEFKFDKWIYDLHCE